MSAVVLSFKHPLAVRRADYIGCEPEYVTLTDFGEQPFVSDRDLGEALGYADPLAAIQQLCVGLRAELAGHAYEVRLHTPEPEGRELIQAFDLEGAMRICATSRTRAAKVVYARLGQRAIAEFVVPDDAAPRAQVLLFPKPRRARKAAKGKRRG